VAVVLQFNPFATCFDFTGTYIVAANGRGTQIFTSIQSVGDVLAHSPTELVGIGALDPRVLGRPCWNMRTSGLTVVDLAPFSRREHIFGDLSCSIPVRTTLDSAVEEYLSRQMFDHR
jgi:hypothetical protein